MEFSLKKPNESNLFVGHKYAEAQILEAINSEKIHHAWLFSGIKGIGKATFAYRLARFILSTGLKKQNALFGQEQITDLSTIPQSPAFLKISSNSHPDLLVIDAENLSHDSKEILVSDIKKINDFLRMTSAETGYKIVIVDSVDHMNRNAANAILKILEEPPENSFFLLVSHNSGSLLPTIKSRCNLINFHTLKATEIEEINRKIFDSPEAEELEFAIKISDGSPGFSSVVYNFSARKIYQKLVNAFADDGDVTLSSLTDFANKANDKESQKSWEIYNFLLSLFISRLIKSKFLLDKNLVDNEHLVFQKFNLVDSSTLSEIYDTHQELKLQAEIYNLDKKSVILNILNQLSQQIL